MDLFKSEKEKRSEYIRKYSTRPHRLAEFYGVEEQFGECMRTSHDQQCGWTRRECFEAVTTKLDLWTMKMNFKSCKYSLGGAVDRF
jgi:hypothetical protein